MNKSRERAIVNAFIKWGGQPGLSLLEWNRERPDALITDGKQDIGIEITAINEAVRRQTIAPQKWMAEAFRIVDEARRIYEARNDQTAVVRFEMRPNWVPPNSQKYSNLAAELASIVEGTFACPPAWPLDKEPYELRDPHTDVSWVYISRSDYGSNWQPSISGKVIGVSEADIRAIVARKESNVATYRQVAPRVWLFIDCDVSGQSIALDVPMQEFTIESNFDRVFCFGFGMWKWIEVSTVQFNDRTG